MTERYILLVGSRYYPNKWSDFVGAFESVESAMLAAIPHAEYETFAWGQIIDTTTLKVVLSLDRDDDDTLIEWEFEQ